MRFAIPTLDDASKLNGLKTALRYIGMLPILFLIFKKKSTRSMIYVRDKASFWQRRSLYTLNDLFTISSYI